MVGSDAQSLQESELPLALTRNASSVLNDEELWNVSASESDKDEGKSSNNGDSDIENVTGGGKNRDSKD